MLEVRMTVADDQVTVALDGEVDLSNEAYLMAELRAAIGEPGIRALRVDLDGLRFLDSAGVRALLRIHQLANQQGVAMQVTRARPMVAHVLQVTNVAELLGMEPDHNAPRREPWWSDDRDGGSAGPRG